MKVQQAERTYLSMVKYAILQSEWKTTHLNEMLTKTLTLKIINYMQSRECIESEILVNLPNHHSFAYTKFVNTSNQHIDKLPYANNFLLS